jgi:MoaA/NifB/PqqE/SkfB family radical SAM enzyme
MRVIAAWPLTGVILSLDGFAPTHDALRGSPGLFDRAFGLLDYLKELRPATLAAIGIVIHRANLAELREFTEMLLAKPEVDRVYFQAIVELRGGPMGAPSFARPALFPDAAAAVAFLDWLRERRKQTNKIANSDAQIASWRRYFVDPADAARAAAPCRTGEHVLTIASNGDVRLCDWHEPIGNVTRDRLRDLWRGPAADSLRERMGRCVAACNYVVNCGFEDLREPPAEV